ncbi:protein kinase [uncultured Jatrophihabitans sp.]|uniref:serine/threonine-protein kinase n=1 Tax=uncultured Jatrophihabitans sp. TaxID=1610747 RepID=UPI0035CC374C
MNGAWRLRGYVVEGLLGHGGAGEVWRARVAATGEKVALKRLAVRDDAQVRRATAEAAKLTVLDHPHLVRLHALVPDRTDVVLVLDLAEGGSLADLLAVRGRLTPGEVITAVAPVAAALAHVHAAGVVHGDVTPANILFTAGGNALLADLGVARLTGQDDDAESTPAYVDPGVAAGGIPSELSDVFMLAATALHALTGELPWPGPDAEQALAQARGGDLGPLPARLADAGVPEPMAAVLCRALDRNPGRRGTAAAFALDLRHSGVPVAVELDAGRVRREPALREPVPPAPTETRPRRGRHAAPPAPARSGRRGGSAALAAPASKPPVASAPVWASGLRNRSEPFDRPSFSRPVLAATGGGAAPDPAPRGAPPPTSRVAPMPRPQLPAPPRGRRTRGHRPRATVVAVALAVVVALGAGALLWRRHLDTSAAAAQPPAPASGAPDRSTTSGAPGRATTTPTSAVAPRSAPLTVPVPVVVPSPPSAVTWAARVSALDAVRARAFAARRPELLRTVYAAPSLLRADSALLMRIVPSGCGLRGVRTAYRDVRVTTSGGRAVVTASAALPASTLVCDGVVRGRAPAVVPTRIRMTLAGPVASARIVDQRPA